ncbi:MAG: hypothetical protein Q8K00_08350 [Syntrophales bacterium]|nr:hypothetical protein [Syntrophales bacterium]
MDMKKRIEALENKLLVDADDQPEGVFCYCVDGRKDAPSGPLPVNGWQHGSDRIMREAGETDEELNKRAIAQVKPSMAKNAVPVFHSINDEGIDDRGARASQDVPG